ncbi:unnamed protein product [Closterium sp. NIES-65]|nr:unnamed protein product [Closterium sp. NIES-65]
MSSSLVAQQSLAALSFSTATKGASLSANRVAVAPIAAPRGLCVTALIGFNKAAVPTKTAPVKKQLRTEDGIFGTSGSFGFTKANELFVGRVAMLGFTASLLGEAVTGQGILSQLNLETGIPITEAEPLLLFFIAFTVLGAIGGLGDRGRFVDDEAPAGPPMKPGSVKAALGLSEEGPLFGFTKANELFVGRMAQLRLAASLVGEVITGRGALAQLNIETGLPVWELEPLLLVSIAFFFIAAINPEKDMAREEGPTAPNEVVNNAAEIDLNQDEAMADIELDDIEDLDLDLGDEHNHGEAENHDEAEHHGEAENHGGADNLGEEDNTSGKEATGDENDFTEGEGTTYPISEEIVQLQAKPAPAPPAPPAVGAATAMHQPPPTETSPFGSLAAPLPEFNHNKTEVQPWLDLVDSTMILANVRPEARVAAATQALDEVARRAVYGAKKQAHGPFEWPEFCTALKEAFMVKKSDLELRGRLERIKCYDRSVQEYAVEFEAAARLLQKPLAEEEMMHIFMKGLPVNLQQAHMTGGMTNWTTYKEMKEEVIKTDNIIRTYIFGPEKTSLQPRAEGSGGHGNRPQSAKGGSGWNKRPFQQRDHQPGPQAKRPNGGGGHRPNKPDFSDKQCRGCGRMGHVIKQCRDKNAIKYSGKPKPGGARPSRKKDFHKPN